MLFLNMVCLTVALASRLCLSVVHLDHGRVHGLRHPRSD
jgi:hypothetical protein